MGIYDPTEESPPAGTATTVPEPEGAEIDLVALAERVFRLIKREAKLERERQGRSYPRRRQVHHGR